MIKREPRHDVDLPARLRGDESWSDVCIRNVSSRGLMLLIDNPPQRSTYIEVRRGSTKRMRHPVVGDLEVFCDVLVVPDRDQKVVLYTAAPGTPSHEALKLLRVIGTQDLTPR